MPMSFVALSAVPMSATTGHHCLKQRNSDASLASAVGVAFIWHMSAWAGVLPVSH